jgi:hypothetical protein
MLGLYFLDATTEEGRAFDYLILADHTGVLGGNAHTGLTWLVSDPTFADVDAWICFNLIRQKADPLVPPADVRAYSLLGVQRG